MIEYDHIPCAVYTTEKTEVAPGGPDIPPETVIYAAWRWLGHCRVLYRPFTTLCLAFRRELVRGKSFHMEVSLPARAAGLPVADRLHLLLVLSCDRYMQNVTLLRQQSADIVFVSHAGLRVPKSAVHVDKNSQPGVYVLEGATAVWKPIQILHDNGESYVVELDRTSTSNLWPGDEVIVGAKNLYDGKVVG